MLRRPSAFRGARRAAAPGSRRSPSGSAGSFSPGASRSSRPTRSGRTIRGCGVVADGSASGRASRLTAWLSRRRGNAPAYLGSEIEAAAGRFRALVDAGRALVSEHTPLDILPAAEASRFLSELINRPGTVWDGATGSGMNWRLALSELEAGRSHLTLDGEPVILYSLLSPPGQAHANLLRELYCLDAAMTVSLEWRPWAVEAARRRIRGAQRHYFAKRYSMMAHMRETEGTAAAMVDSAAATESDRLGAALVELEADGDQLRGCFAHRGAARRPRSDRRGGRRPPAPLCRARREGDTGGLRPAPGLVLAAAGPTPRPAGAEGVRLGGHGRVPRAAVRASEGHPRERAPRPRGARGARDAVADGLPLRPLRGRRGAHADAGRHGLGQELHAELPPGRGAQVRPAGPDPRPRRLLPMAHAVRRGPLPRALARRSGAVAPPPAVRPPGDDPHLPVPDGVGAPAAQAGRGGRRAGGTRARSGPGSRISTRSSPSGARSACWPPRSLRRCGRP